MMNEMTTDDEIQNKRGSALLAAVASWAAGAFLFFGPPQLSGGRTRVSPSSMISAAFSNPRCEWHRVTGRISTFRFPMHR